MTKNIVYLVHGARGYYDQARMSILTLLDLLFKQSRDDYRLFVICGKSEGLPRHRCIEPITLSPRQLRRWRGPLDFGHRIKLETLRAAAELLREPFIFVDCDTRWLRLPDAEFDVLATAGHNGRPAFFMHMYEGEISPHFFPRYYRHLTDHAATQLARWEINSGPWGMWNSGVVGVAPASVGRFFDDALAVSDVLLPFLRPHTWVEQCAISILAQSRCSVRPLDQCLDHYWKFGSAAPDYLHRILSDLDPTSSVERQADYCGRYAWDVSQLLAIQSAPVHRLRRWVTRQKNSFRKRKRDLKSAWLRRNLRRAIGGPWSNVTTVRAAIHD